MTILGDILERKRREVADAMRHDPEDAVRARAYVQAPARSFAARLRAPSDEPARLIAEIKRKSPSVGSMAEIRGPSDLALTYVANGASAISVLTDHHHFGGSLSDLREVRDAVTVPVLRKDFLFTDYQLWEARGAGADAVLLIVSALASPLGDPDNLGEPRAGAEPDLATARERLSRLMATADKAGLEVLVEVHDAAEAAVAVAVKAPVIGINNRNLTTFVTSLETTESVIASMNGKIGYRPIIVSESGLRNGADVSRVRQAGAHAILVGEALVRAVDISAKVREMAGVVRP
jgi:indole-3-glycerol phosphate synthase